MKAVALLLAALLAALLSSLLGGCGPWLYAVSTPPPGSIGNLDTDDERAELTAGSALAFRCDDGGPCQGARATSDDPSIAEVLPASLARLEMAAFDGFTPQTTFVIVGKSPGKTRIRVRTSDGNVDLAVRVHPAPTPVPVPVPTPVPVPVPVPN